tara:strand:- start:1055 stop:1759 length:705 start_codon:yes stop_codon:yes gene_type:complete
MDGYIGGRAKRRRRNTIIFIVSFFVICFLIYVIPSFQLNETAPPDSLLPSEEEILTPAINSTIEELELEVFDKEQKIIFRNKQIKELNAKINILFIENNELSKSITQLSDELSLQDKSDNKAEETNKRISNQIEILKKNNEKKIEQLNNKLVKIDNEKNLLFKENENIKNENTLLKKEYKSLMSKNIKLNSSKDNSLKEKIEIESLKKKILVLDVLIQEQQLIIKVLSDTSHHG